LYTLSPPYTVLSVPDTRIDFTFCCPFKWKRNTNENFVLSDITWETITGELLSSRPDRFIRGKEG